MIFDRPIDQFVSRPEGVAGCHDFGGSLLSGDTPISSRRIIRIDITNQASGGIGSGQYCGRARAGKYRQLRTAFANFTGLSERAGDPHAVGRARRHPADTRFGTSSRPMRQLGENASCLDTISAGQVSEMMPFAIRRSPIAIRPQTDAAP